VAKLLNWIFGGILIVIGLSQIMPSFADWLAGLIGLGTSLNIVIYTAFVVLAVGILVFLGAKSSVMVKFLGILIVLVGVAEILKIVAWSWVPSFIVKISVSLLGIALGLLGLILIAYVTARGRGEVAIAQD
jgi:hypothetical protein